MNTTAVMKKVCIFTLFVSLVPLPAQQVDEAELRSGAGSISFTNYEGPYARIDTREEIRALGAGPGAVVASGGVTAGNTARYFVIHSVTEPEGDRLNADIFGLGSGAGVDHIRNLRLIIQGYLTAAYHYSESDAALLAEFITVYNAVYRGKGEYFSGRYKTAVLGHLDPVRAGLSTRFDEWPGQTLMVIPLMTAVSGSLSAIDTGSLTAPEVIDEMRSAEDRGVDSRREMVDLMEREAESAAEQSARQREAADREQERIDREREAAAAERERIAEERAETEAAAAAGRITPEEAARREEGLAAREEAAAETEERLGADEEAAAVQRREADASQALAEERETAAREQRQDIARDQQEIIAAQDAAREAAPVGILGVELSGADSTLGRMVRLNTATGDRLRAGALNTVNPRAITLAGGKLVAIAGESRGNAAIRLIEINQETLEMAAQGDVDIHPQSLLWSSGDNLYAMTVSGGGVRLARFNTNLARVAESVIAVHPLGAPVIQGDILLIQRADGSVALLNAMDLSERR
ncbi:MAG: hypothetical protein LBC88_09940 [Spirochaetaceae bacterium]|jgi:hypothetical protein|nr:hypothetical protein [Spirochaetaceae bacterium]